jgi:hypothetical protein
MSRFFHCVPNGPRPVQETDKLRTAPIHIWFHSNFSDIRIVVIIRMQAGVFSYSDPAPVVHWSILRLILFEGPEKSCGSNQNTVMFAL